VRSSIPLPLLPHRHVSHSVSCQGLQQLVSQPQVVREALRVQSLCAGAGQFGAQPLVHVVCQGGLRRTYGWTDALKSVAHDSHVLAAHVHGPCAPDRLYSMIVFGCRTITQHSWKAAFLSKPVHAHKYAMQGTPNRQAWKSGIGGLGRPWRAILVTQSYSTV
jgi:hypothetical protein